MKRSILIALGPVTVFVALIGVGGSAVVDLDTLLAGYPPVRQVISEHVDLAGISRGIVREYGAYHIDDEPMSISAWYKYHYHLQPEPGSRLIQADACIQLVKADHYRLARLTLVVSLCPSGQGTEISFNHTLSFGR